MKKIVTFLIPFILAACSTPPLKEPPVADKAKTEPAAVANSDKTPAQATNQNSDKTNTTADIKTENLTAEMQKLHSQSIYFDFDNSTIKPEFRSVVEQQAAFLKTHGSDTITVEGNADERGSNEYNLALGNRRASATRKNLELLGIPSSQIKVVSYGEEKPRLTCHEEKCWQENRRCDFSHKLN
ncbi:MAG: peptidoglycan-associated lipoprotein Pal [Gallionellaceae bacterium]|nr:peptidoglycan-associated lipoprotein Pal [Gallionellaceae bacterium]